MESGFHMLLYRAFHAQRSCLRPWRAALGLGPGQPKLIEYLARSGPCSQRQLATYFEIDPAAVCRMLDALEKGGFVTRSAVKGDRRTGMVELTEKGRSAAAAWQHACGEMEQQLLQGFTPEEAERFAQYLRRARENLRAVQSHRQKEDVP
ncbi:MAG TPA: MarR family transcriptional regulator [Candidatus Faecalibacterium faecigallinarum]|uniref:MarR family transcriptional regulator n=1 Tax=Candidatus Faecalibacterium faecigallinarum TaxID=2838577 RepID=A0A9D2PBA6_9FIRM|nr:MarR family transcriptional regulator [Candidatus Faecalibacterium faecigallinarum]